MLRLSEPATLALWIAVAATAMVAHAFEPADDLSAQCDDHEDSLRRQFDRHLAVVAMSSFETLLTLGLAHYEPHHGHHGSFRISEACKQNALAKECM